MSYSRFFAMIATSTVVMLFLMYLNTYAFDHVSWSETRFYMAFIMGSSMAAIMLSFMRSMYQNKMYNISIFIMSAVIFIGALFLVRSQVTVQDNSYMSAMIPHHSIAIMTSERAQIEDVRVRKLANDIIRAQRREIEEMQWLIADIKANGLAETEEDAKNRPLPKIEGKVNPEGKDDTYNKVYKDE